MRRFVSVALALAVAAPAAAVATAADDSVRAGANYRLGRDRRPARASDVPGLAIDPADARHIVATHVEYRTPRCMFHASFDGGATWKGGALRGPEGFSDPLCRPLDDGGYSPSNGSVVFGSGQNVYTAFSSKRGDAADSVLVARSTDGGRTFKRAVVALEGSSDGRLSYIRPVVAATRGPDGKDTVYVVAWRLPLVYPGACCAYDMWSAVSVDGGATFQEPTQVSAPEETTREQSHPVIAPDRSVHVAYRQRVGLAVEKNYVRLATLEPTEEGGAWTQRTVLEVPGLFQPKLAADRDNGHLYIAYQGNHAGDNDVFVVSSTDGGETWSGPVRVNDDPEGNGVAQRTPWISVAPGGRIDVTWYDRRNFYPGAVSSGHFGTNVILEDVYYAYSMDGGKTFSANHRITDRTNNRDVGIRNEIGNYWPPVSAALGRNRLLVAWADSREGNADTDNQDIYLSQVDLDPSGPLPARRLASGRAPRLSVALSRHAYPGGREDQGGKPVTRAIVVNRSRPELALAAAVLARANPGPMLAAGRRGLPKPVGREVGRMDPVGAFLIGGKRSLPERVTKQLVRRDIPRDQIVRIGGSGPAAVAAGIARAMDVRSEDDRAAQAPAFPAAVVVNPGTAGAGAAAAFAASLRYPILYAGKDRLPDATKKALDQLDIPATIVVATRSAIGDEVVASLPQPTRLSGAGPVSLSRAVVRASIQRALPHNVVYVAPPRATMKAALLGASVARAGGVMLLASDVSAARRSLSRVKGSGEVDRLEMVR